MKKTRILHILISNKFAGAENVVCEIIKSTPNDYEIGYSSLAGEIEETLNELSIRFLPLNKISKNEFERVINIFKPDIIHAHDFKASTIVSICNFSGKTISHIHHQPDFINSINIRSIAYLVASLKFSKIVSVSNSIFEKGICRKILNNKIQTIPNFVSSKKVMGNLPNEGVVKKYDLVFLGRLETVKDPTRFIRLIYELQRYFPSIKAVIIGNGSLFNVCERLITKLNLKKNVELVGYKKDPYPILNMSKILVSTSQREGFGINVVEAMCLGIPAICNDVGGLCEIIDETSGRLCGDDKSFIEAIKLFLNDDTIYNDFSKSAKERSNKFTDRDQFVKALTSLYSSIR